MKKLLGVFLIFCLLSGFIIVEVNGVEKSEDEISLSSYLKLDEDHNIVYIYKREFADSYLGGYAKIIDYVKFKEAADKIFLERDNSYNDFNLSPVGSLVIKIINAENQTERSAYISLENEIRMCDFHISPAYTLYFELSYNEKYKLSDADYKNIIYNLWEEGVLFDGSDGQRNYDGVEILGENFPFISASNKQMASVGEIALNMGIVPKYIDKDYGSPITREAFCDTVYNALSRVTDLPEFLNTNIFIDTENKKVNLLKQIGIIKGRSEDKFYPLSYLTRQEAATILDRMTNFLEINKPDVSDFKYNDDEKISDWAKESVYAMFEHNIMNGDGNHNFNPIEIYAKDQSFLTIIGFIEIANVNFQQRKGME